jgi:hypothetical protein
VIIFLLVHFLVLLQSYPDDGDSKNDRNMFVINNTSSFLLVHFSVLLQSYPDDDDSKNDRNMFAINNT